MKEINWITSSTKKVKKRKIKPIIKSLKQNKDAKWNGTMLFTCIFVRKQLSVVETTKTTIHEGIHFYQALELLVVGFYLLYGLFFLFYFAKYRNREAAYKRIPFEQEAYKHQMRPDYWDTRKWYSWIKYIKE